MSKNEFDHPPSNRRLCIRSAPYRVCNSTTPYSFAEHPPQKTRMSNIRNQTVPARRNQFIDSWRKFAPELTLAGVTLAQFEAETQELADVRQRLNEAKTEVAGVIIDRQQADDRAREKMILLAHALRGDPAYGEDCAFYRAIGFVPKSERKSSIRRNPVPVVMATAPAVNVA